MIINSISLLAFLALYILWAFVFRSQRVDATRSELFALRHELFMLGATRRIEFDAPAYRATERLLNALIKYAHRLQLGRAIVTRALGAKSDGEIERIYQTIQNHPDENVREQLIQIAGKAGLYVLKHVAESTLPTWILLSIAYRVQATRGLLRTYYDSRGSDKVRRIEEDALLNATDRTIHAL